VIEMRSGAKRAIARIVNALVTPLGPLLGRHDAIPAHPRVLLVRCDHIGDAVMATPVLRPLREALDPERLDVLAAPWSAAVFEGNPAVDSVITYAAPWWLAARGVGARADRMRAWAALPRVIADLRARRYDIAIDLRGDLRQILYFLLLGRASARVSSDRTGGAKLLTKVWSYDRALHEVEKNMAVAALLDAHGAPSLDVAVDVPTDRDARLREATGPAGVLAMAVSAREPSRAWAPDKAAELARLARTRLGLGTVVLGGPNDRAAAATIVAEAGVPVLSLAGTTTVQETLAVFAASTVAVCTDSGPMHLAAAAGVPLVALFGPGDPRQSRPWSDRAVVLAAPGGRMAALTPEAVVAAVGAAIAIPV
jgi:ADP-heptose:LPS heptosyltransferase